MQTERQIDATVSNEEIQQADANQGKKADKSEIVNLIRTLPVKERMDLIRDLQNAANRDADIFSTGREATTAEYDTLRDRYQKEAKDAEKKQEEQPA